MFYIVQAGASLQVINNGVVSTLTLPTGVTIDATIRGKFAILNGQIVFVRAPSVNLWIDVAAAPFTVRPMSMAPPLSAPDLAAGSGSGLTGTYQVKVSFTVKDLAGRLLAESPLSSASLPVTLTNDDLSITNIEIPGESWVTGRRLYRTADGGTDFFKMLDIDDVSTTSVITTMQDAQLSLLPAAPNLGNPPGAIPGTSLTNIVPWKGRLFAVPGDPTLRDNLQHTDINKFYGWPADFFFPANPKGEDAFGITGLMPRRDTLGFAKRTRLYKLTGSGDADFAVDIVAENLGCVAPDSVVITRDVAYFLGPDGVYKWDDQGAQCISRSTVDGWFTTDTYFNRDRFPFAFGGYNPKTNCYELHLAAAGSSVEDRWISFQIDIGEWLGIHRTSAFTPTSRNVIVDESSITQPAIGAADGYLYEGNQAVTSDIPGATGVAAAISYRVETKWHTGRDPDIEHFWGRLSVFNRIESAGTTLSVTPYTGGLDAAAQTAYTADLTLDRQILGILGTGRLMKLVFSQESAGRKVLQHGYKVEPFHEVGRR